MLDLYMADIASIGYEEILGFVLAAEQVSPAVESTTVEFKAKQSKSNIAEAVAALANTDGGLVFVGVDEKQTGEAKIVGILREDVDAVVNSLRSLLPRDAFPEVIPVARPDGETVVLLLRVDADAAAHPVVLGGRVLVRYPGQTVGATREQVLALAARQPAASSLSLPALRHSPLQGEASALFADDEPFAYELRLIGRATLPHRVLRRAWLDTRAREAAQHALASSPLPEDLWHGRRDPAAPQFVWQENHAGSTYTRVASTRIPPLSSSLTVRQGGCYLTLDGRMLSMLLGIRVRPGQLVGHVPGHLEPLQVENLYGALLGLLATHVAVTREVAESLGAAAPLQFGAREAWLLPGAEYTVRRVVNLAGQREPVPGNEPQKLWFVPVEGGADIDELDRLARMWVEVVLLDAGSRGFETALRGLDRPFWVRDSSDGS